VVLYENIVIGILNASFAICAKTRKNNKVRKNPYSLLFAPRTETTLFYFRPLIQISSSGMKHLYF